MTDRDMWQTLYMEEGTTIEDMWLKLQTTMRDEMAAQQGYVRSLYMGTPSGAMRTLTSLYKTGYIKRELGIAIEFTNREIGEVIRQAANVLETYGWIQNAKGDVIHGFCTIGAIDYAAHSQQQSVNIGTHLYSAASKKFFDWLVEAGITEHSIATWNDQPERSRDEIVLYMHKFAEEMAPEDAPTPRPMPRLVL